MQEDQKQPLGVASPVMFWALLNNPEGKRVKDIPGPCKGEPGLHFAISPSTEMTPALRGPAADD